MLPRFFLVACLASNLLAVTPAEAQSTTRAVRKADAGLDASVPAKATPSRSRNQAPRATRLPVRKPYFEFAIDAPAIQPRWMDVKLSAKLPKVRRIRRPSSRETSLPYATLPVPPAAGVDSPTEELLPTPRSRPQGPRPIRETHDNMASSHVVSLSPRTSINLERLSQHIASHNLSVRAIDDLLRVQNSWALADLESVTRQIDEVLAARELWKLYYDLLTPKDRRRLASIAALTPVLERLEQRLFETEVSVDYDPNTISPLHEKRTLQRLKQLGEQVDQWGKKTKS